jgi:hypothetical protein
MHQIKPGLRHQDLEGIHLRLRQSATIQKQKILASKFRFDLMHWNISIGPEQWPIFGRFLMLFPLKHPAQHGGDRR